MKKISILLLLLALSNCIPLIAQKTNQASNISFKIAPRVNATTPDWAKMMYSDYPNAYEVERARNEYYKTHKFVKNQDTQNYKRWINEIQFHLDSEGNFEVKDRTKAKSLIKKEYKKRLLEKNNKNLIFDWSLIGPKYTVDHNSTTSTPGKNQANVYTLALSETNPSIMFAGTESGGVYKTSDAGENWTLITADLPLTRIYDIEIAPTNNDIIFVLGKTPAISSELKLYRVTVNQNNTIVAAELWSTFGCCVADGTIALVGNSTNYDQVTILVGMHNSGRGSAEKGLFRLSYGFIDHEYDVTRIYSEDVWDLKVRKGNRNAVFMLKSDASNSLLEFHKSTNAGLSFTKKSSGWYTTDGSPGDNKVLGGRLGLTSSNFDVVYAVVAAELDRLDIGYLGIFRSNNSGESWNRQNANLGDPYSDDHQNPLSSVRNDTSGFDQGHYNLAIGVSSTDADKIILGGLAISHSTDGGQSLTRLAGYNSELQISNFHVDVQDIHFVNDDAWIANDGGVTTSKNIFTALPSFTNKNQGIHAAEFWGFSQGWNSDILYGGTNHNGDRVYNGDVFSDGVFKTIANGSAEEPAGAVNPGDNTLYSEHTRDDPFGIRRSELPPSETSIPTILSEIDIDPNVNNKIANSTEIEFHPNCFNDWYIGSGNKILFVEQNGKKVNTLYSFTQGPDGTTDALRVLQVKVDRSNTDIIYAVVELDTMSTTKSGFFKSIDGGLTFQMKVGFWATGTGATFDINHNTGAIYWAIYHSSISSENDILVSLDRGENWNALFLPEIDGLSFNYIISGQDRDNTGYLGTNFGVYQYKPNASGVKWEKTSAGLPFAAEVRKLAIFHRDGKLRVGLNGFGVWEADLDLDITAIMSPTANVINSKFCERSFQLDSYSIINQKFMTWEWSFSRTPDEIDSYYIRNPKVKFSQGAPVDVTLNAVSIVGARSVFASKTITGMLDLTCESEFASQGDASESNTSCHTITTSNNNFVSGALWNAHKINLDQSFSIEFELNLGGSDATDGIGFVLQRKGLEATSKTSDVGTKGISPSVAVAFQTYVSDKIDIWPNGLGSSGSIAPNTPSITGSGTLQIRITWDPATKKLEIDKDRNGTIDISMTRDLVKDYFNDDPSDIIWGFTARTGNATMHQVCNIAMSKGGCPPNYADDNKLGGQQSKDFLYDTYGKIQSNQEINQNAKVELNTIKDVELLENFMITEGAMLNVQMTGCTKEDVEGTGYCLSPYKLECGVIFQGDNFSGSSLWRAYAANASWTAPEIIHSIEIPPSQSRTITMSGLTADLDLFALSSCDENNRLDQSDNPGASDEDVTIMNNTTQTKTYYIVVDGWQNARGRYILSCEE